MTLAYNYQIDTIYGLCFFRRRKQNKKFSHENKHYDYVKQHPFYISGTEK